MLRTVWILQLPGDPSKDLGDSAWGGSAAFGSDAGGQKLAPLGAKKVTPDGWELECVPWSSVMGPEHSSSRIKCCYGCTSNSMQPISLPKHLAEPCIGDCPHSQASLCSLCVVGAHVLGQVHPELSSHSHPLGAGLFPFSFNPGGFLGLPPRLCLFNQTNNSHQHLLLLFPFPFNCDHGSSFEE